METETSTPLLHDSCFEMATSNVRFGPGATSEVGMDLADLGARRVMLLTDPVLAGLPPVHTVRKALEAERIDYVLFTDVRVEPTDRSMAAAIEAAQRGAFDAFVAVGGGSTIDTAKVANLYSVYPAQFLTYVNAPLGQGRPVPGPLKPLVAIPTTAGTGSETTGVAIFDLSNLHAKTGIAHRRLKPTLGIVDPDNTRTMPPLVAAATGLDVLCHAVESYTAIPFNSRPRPARPLLRPAYQGANPISDIWSEKSMSLVAENLLRAVRNPHDDQARANMLLASTYAGIGFGNAGVHLCHGMSYPVSGMVRDYYPEGYPADHALVPHGISVALHAPAVFRFTASACPERHLKAAALLGAEIGQCKPAEAGEVLAGCFIDLMQRLQLPNGLEAIGFSKADAPALARGTLPQHRVTKLSPRPASEEDLVRLFEQSMRLW
jgi:hydroxyacid-oxoacid transhydrogenase